MKDALACPACGGGLDLDENSAKCRDCAARYPIDNGVLDFLTPPSHDSDRDEQGR